MDHIKLKFRAWLKNLKVMRQVFALTGLGIDNLMIEVIGEGNEPAVWSCRPDETELMQWSGLNDVIGDPIYEGDIINNRIDTVSGIHDQFGIISFGEHETSDDYYASTAFGFYIKYVNNVFGSTVRAMPCKDIIVVSNIYENPSLVSDE